MSLRLVCPGCQAVYRVPEKHEGRKVRCKKCGRILVVESAEEPVDVLPVAEEVPARRKPVRRDEEDPDAWEERDRPRTQRPRRKEKETISSGLRVAGMVAVAVLVVGGGIVAGILKHMNSAAPAGGSFTANYPADPGSAAPASPASYPVLGAARRIEPGVLMHEIFLRPGDPSSQIWVYLPERAQGKLPCVMIAPAGSTLFVGMNLGEGDRVEHLPYVRAGFAVVAYAISGDCPNLERAPDARVVAAATAFKNAQAGLVNARQALDFTLARVEAIDPQRLYTAGHSSAATLSLLVAEHDRRIHGCVAYAPASDVASHIAPVTPMLSTRIPGFGAFANDSSPLNHAAELRCPLFLFHAQDDTTVPIIQSVRFAREVQKVNARVTFVRVPRGGHYDSMMRQGIPQAITWLQGLARES